MKRRYIILLFAAAAGGLGSATYIQQSGARAELARLGRSADALREKKAALEERIAGLREANRDLKIDLDFRSGQVRQVLAAQKPESPVWADPPAQWPAWEPESPFIWVPKTAVEQLSIELFSPNGELLSAFAAIAALDPEQAKAVTREVREIVQEFSRLEQAHTRLTNSHLAGITLAEGPAVTIHVPAIWEQSSHLKDRFQQALETHMGAQRAEMALKLASEWVAERLSNFGKEPRTISAQLKPNGYYYVATQSAGGWMSMGRKSLDDFVPPHLMEFFVPVMAEQTSQ